jgi:methyl-accepting chemotaxis protein
VPTFLRQRARASSVEQQALAVCAEQSGVLGVELVDVAGDVESVAERAAAQAATFEALSSSADGVQAAAQEVVEASGQVASGAEQAQGCVDDSRSRMTEALDQVGELSAWVSALGEQLSEVTATIASVSEVAAQIDRIAHETHILALNARIEAARAGDQGKGFAVIADSVRTLSERTQSAARGMGATLQSLATPLERLQTEGRGAGQRAVGVLEGASAVDAALHDAGSVLAQVLAAAEGISGLAVRVGAQAADTGSSLAELAVDATTTRDDLVRARRRVTSLLDLSEQLLQTTTASGVETLDSPFVRAAQAAAAEVGRLFAEQLAGGATTVGDLFDEAYRPVPGSNPAQVSTRFTALTDRLLPGVQEPVLGLDDRVVFCAAVDRNGYLPTHNRVFSSPQGPDPVWNTAHCRNRRIFDDRTGLAAARSTTPYLLQTYRRDMGGGAFSLMKDVSAPVWVEGRHWGAVRIAYRV